MRHLARIALLTLVVVGCKRQPAGDVSTGSLVDARKGFATKLVPGQDDRQPADTPPARVFKLVKYESPAGKLAAYLTPDPADDTKHPAIVWITGGDCNSIGDVWSPAKPDNDQTAAAFRKSGVVMMFPSLRGGNDNPGRKEGFFGEVDDVIAAADFLAKQPYVDSGRIYLGGHSTGGTLALLVAECTDRFRTVFSFGPVDDVSGYGADSGFLPFDTANAKEVELRSPGRWLHAIKSPTFVFEGASAGNAGDLKDMARKSTNPQAHFFAVRGANHFSVLGPVNKLIAERVVKDDGPASTLAFTEDELGKLFGK